MEYAVRSTQNPCRVLRTPHSNWIPAFAGMTNAKHVDVNHFPDLSMVFSMQTRPSQREFLGHPLGLSVLFLSETWERFSFYGVVLIFVQFVATTLND